MREEIIERIQAEILSLAVDWLNLNGKPYQEKLNHLGREAESLICLAKNPRRFIKYFIRALQDPHFERLLGTPWMLERLCVLKSRREGKNENREGTAGPAE